MASTMFCSVEPGHRVVAVPRQRLRQIGVVAGDLILCAAPRLVPVVDVLETLLGAAGEPHGRVGGHGPPVSGTSTAQPSWSSPVAAKRCSSTIAASRRSPVSVSCSSRPCALARVSPARRCRRPGAGSRSRVRRCAAWRPAAGRAARRRTPADPGSPCVHGCAAGRPGTDDPVRRRTTTTDPTSAPPTAPASPPSPRSPRPADRPARPAQWLRPAQRPRPPAGRPAPAGPRPAPAAAPAAWRRCHDA